MSSRPNPRSTIGRVREFFVANPDEELTADDIGVKFDLERERVLKLLYVLRLLAFLEQVPFSYPLAYRYTGIPVENIRWKPTDYRARDPRRRPDWVRA
jgi:hypothetical protein